MIDAKEFAKALALKELTPSAHVEWDIETADLNRPGLQFVGYYEHFAYERPQVIGKTEMAYLDSLDPVTLQERLRQFFGYAIPCLVICRGLRPPHGLLALAREHGIGVYQTEEVTTRFTLNAINYLTRALAPRITRHGVLVDVYGVGILLTGESGVGKSEAALELVKRGHQLVADDVVDICRVNDTRLTGESPPTIRHFMEIRGIGVIDIRAMFGIGSVLLHKSIDMEIHMEAWVEKKEYDRLGLSEEFTSILDVRIPRLVLPVKPGRNLAIIIEVAARNFRLKRLGYSAANELDKRLNDMAMNARLAQETGEQEE